MEEVLGAAAHGVQELAEEGVRSFREEVRHRLVVEIEGGAADLCLPAELLHGNQGEVLALQQAQQGLVHPLRGAEVFAVSRGHGKASLCGGGKAGQEPDRQRRRGFALCFGAKKGPALGLDPFCTSCCEKFFPPYMPPEK